MPRTRRFALRNCLDAGVRSTSAIYKEEEGDLERKRLGRGERIQESERVVERKRGLE